MTRAAGRIDTCKSVVRLDNSVDDRERVIPYRSASVFLTTEECSHEISPVDVGRATCTIRHIYRYTLGIGKFLTHTPKKLSLVQTSAFSWALCYCWCGLPHSIRGSGRHLQL